MHKEQILFEQTTKPHDHADGRLVPSEVDLPEVLRPKPRDAWGSETISSMKDRWMGIAAHLPGRKGEVLRSTLEGKSLEGDYRAITQTVAFIYDAILKGESDVEYLTAQLYDNRETFFPLALQEMEHFGPQDVSGAHEGRNPLLHTCVDMAEYVAEIVAAPDAARPSDQTLFVEITALLLHDYGKLFDPKDPTHGSGSVFWSERWITGLAETFPDKSIDPDIISYQLKFLMKFHDLPGNIDLGTITVEDAVKIMLDEGYVPSSQLLLSLERIQEADMRGTPGMPQQFRTANRRILRELRQTLITLKEQYHIADQIIPSEELISEDKNLVQQFFALLAAEQAVAAETSS